MGSTIRNTNDFDLQAAADAWDDLPRPTDPVLALIAVVAGDYRFRRVNRHYATWLGLAPDPVVPTYHLDGRENLAA